MYKIHLLYLIDRSYLAVFLGDFSLVLYEKESDESEKEN